MATIGFTAKLELDNGSGTFAVIDEATMITVPAQETTTVETTHLNLSTPIKTFTPGLTDPGVLSFEANYTKASYNQLNAVRGKLKDGANPIPPTGDDIKWKITAPDDGTPQVFTFNGILTKLELGFETEAVVKIKGEVKVSGEITIA